MEITQEIFDKIVKDVLAVRGLCDYQKSDFLVVLTRAYPQYSTEEIDKLIDDLDC